MILAAALLLFVALPAAAKDGFSIGINTLFNEISSDVNSPEWADSGNGLGLRGGFGLNRYLSIEAAIWKTKHDIRSTGATADLKAGTADLKLTIPLPGSQIEPYLFAGYGKYTLEQGSISEDGTGWRIGIGMEIYLFPEISFNVGLTRNDPTFKHSGSDVDGRITTLDFGFTYHFI
jgi:hypothetical protein